MAPDKSILHPISQGLGYGPEHEGRCMQTFGSKNFENIFAVRWLAELEQCEDLKLIVNTLTAIDPDDPQSMSTSNCYRAILASEVLAALRGFPAPHLPPQVLAWVKKKEGPISQDIISLADDALNLIMVQSELTQQWAKTGQLDSWKRSVSNLHFRIIRPKEEEQVSKKSGWLQWIKNLFR